MKLQRRRWLQWPCAQCAFWATACPAQTDWVPPQRFARPDAASDEGGLWAMLDREEARLRRSPFRIRDEVLNRYLSDVACRLGGEHCSDIRVYAMQMPYFNASMAPNGMMQVWSGLLLRMENEAQLAVIVGHEIGHYLERHTVQMLRDAKARSAFALALAPFGLIGLVGQLAVLGSAFAFSRDQEREADTLGARLMERAGYDVREAPKVWGNLLAELQANPGNDPGLDSVLFATHPPSDERRRNLEQLAANSSGGGLGEAAYRRAIEPIRSGLLEDELKRGRYAESLVLLNRLVAREPESAELLYFRGEAYRLRATDGDAALALADLEAAVRSGNEPAATHRSLGHVYRTQQRSDDARRAWLRYLDAAPNAPDNALVRQMLEELK
jgi:beta-barrel assembly-enhancing protease